MPFAGNMHIFDCTNDLYSALKKQWFLLANAAIKDHGAFNVALAGGSTPRKLYKILAKQLAVGEPCWDETHIFFGDERCVPQDDPESNYRMVQESLLAGVSLPPDHVHAMFSGDLSVEENVSKYNALLLETLPLNDDGLPVFDLVLLGMGEDGHTASLFPETEILHDSKNPVAAQFVKKLNAWRISFTLPLINAAHHVAILVAGEAKSKVILNIFSEPENDVMQYPVQRVNPTGQLDWYLDAAAAQLLKVRD